MGKRRDAAFALELFTSLGTPLYRAEPVGSMVLGSSKTFFLMSLAIEVPCFLMYIARKHLFMHTSG